MLEELEFDGEITMSGVRVDLYTITKRRDPDPRDDDPKLKAKVVTVVLVFGKQENIRLIITPDTKTWHVVMRLGYGPHFELSRKFAGAFGWNERIWRLIADGDELVLTARG